MVSFYKKICSRKAICSKISDLPKPVVFTNGVFDILHRGHVTYLAQARAFGASLVVAVNTDESVKRLGKGDDRPIKGGDYDMTAIPEGKEVLAYGGRVMAIDFEYDRSTTALLNKVRRFR